MIIQKPKVARSVNANLPHTLQRTLLGFLGFVSALTLFVLAASGLALFASGVLPAMLAPLLPSARRWSLKPSAPGGFFSLGAEGGAVAV